MKTGIGDPPPPAARLFGFPTAEKFGVIWAFNGERARFDLPDFDHPAAELTFRTEKIEETFDVDPWVFCCNTPDLQHLKALHGFRFEHDDPDRDIEWTEHSMSYELRARVADSAPIDFRVGIFGTNIFRQNSMIDGRWFGIVIAFGLPRPGRSSVFFSLAARTSDGDAESTAAFLDSLMDFEKRVFFEDGPIMRTIHFKPGTLTRSDKVLARFFDYLRSYPRAHPSADFTLTHRRPRDGSVSTPY